MPTRILGTMIAPTKIIGPLNTSNSSIWNSDMKYQSGRAASYDCAGFAGAISSVPFQKTKNNTAAITAKQAIASRKIWSGQNIPSRFGRDAESSSLPALIKNPSRPSTATSTPASTQGTHALPSPPQLNTNARVTSVARMNAPRLQ